MNSRTILSAEPAFNGDDVDLSNPCDVRTILWLFVLFVAGKQVVCNRSFASHEKHEETRKKSTARWKAKHRNPQVCTVNAAFQKQRLWGQKRVPSFGFLKEETGLRHRN